MSLEAARIAREYSTPVFILSDSSLATRIEAFEEPDLPSLMADIKPDISPRPVGFEPYPLNAITRHAPPGSRIEGNYPIITGLEHDTMGHPTGSPKLHVAMTAKRREKLKQLAASLPAPEVTGEDQGDILMVGWGSTYGPIHEAVLRLQAEGHAVSAMHIRHIHPLPNGLEKIFDRFKQIVVIEMNDEGLYGYGQIAMLLRARYCNPNIRSLTKTDGLTFKIREISVHIQSLLAGQ
jgi:2-oxoglutarate ferredoxin oxidoreductase subunit alpha